MVATHKAVGKAHRNERAAIAQLKAELPDGYYMITNVELRAGRHRTYEHDVVVIAPWMVFAVELKAYSGRTVGNRDRWELEGGKMVDSPVPLQNQKAKVLKTQLGKDNPHLRGIWVQPLVFMTAHDAKVELTSDYDGTVCTRADIIAALTNRHAWPRARDLTRSDFNDIRAVLEDGRRPLKEVRIGDFELDARLPERADAPYEIWRGRKHGNRRTLHVYPIRGGDEKLRQRNRDIARREATLHERLRGGPGLLNYLDLAIVESPEEQFVLSFEDTQPYLPLPDWLGRHKPGMQARLRVGQRITEALRFVHGKDVVHRGLTPETVLIPNVPEPDQVRLYALELARDLARQLATISAGRLSAMDQRCIAPEMLRSGEATRRSDRFALGATLYELLTGTPAFDSAADILAGAEPDPLRLDGLALPDDVALIVETLIDPDPMARPSLDEALEVLTQAQLRPPEPEERPLEVGLVVARHYQLEARLGEGATASAWRVCHRIDQRRLVAKIAHDADAGVALRHEGAILQAVEHPNLVRYQGAEVHEGASILLLGHVDGESGDEWAVLADPMSPEQARQFGEGLLGALGALHAGGWLHRDVKPANLLLSEPDAAPTLIDLGLACAVDDDDATGAVLVGTARYKDPLLYDAGRWTPRDDLYAAWLTIFEILTGSHPYGAVPSKDATPQLDVTQLPFPKAAIERVEALAGDVLSMDAARRPADAPAAIARWQAVFHEADQPAQVVSKADPVALPAHLTAQTSVDVLPLSVRAQRALTTLGITAIGQLSRVDDAELLTLRNVGRATVAQIRDYANAARARLGEPVVAAVRMPPPAPGLFMGLSDDERPLSALGAALTPKAAERLVAEGITTIGALARTPRRQLATLKSIGAARIDALAQAMSALAGEAPVASLDALDARLQDELGAGYAAVAAVFGLVDGVARRHVDAAAHIDRTRQRVEQALHMDVLRADASVGRQLTTTIKALIPKAGVTTIARLATRLAAVLPFEGELSAMGYARLGVALLDPEDRGLRAVDMDVVSRPPWTPAQVELLRDALVRSANWPPLPSKAAAELLWERATAEGLSDHLRSRQVDPAGLLKAIKATCEAVRATPDGALFTPPVRFSDALLASQGSPALLDRVDAVHAYLQQRFEAVLEPVDRAAELAAVGLEVVDDRVVPIERPEAAPATQIKVDGPIRTRHVTPDGALEVGDLVAACHTGGFRVVGLPPASHHRLSVHLRDALAAQVGAEKVRFIDLDRAIIEALRAHALWDDALAEESLTHPDFSWLTEDVGEALTAQIAEGTRGTITVLARPTLLGPLGLMDWLHGLYEAARGGRFGLLVLAAPGGIHDGRVRLNEAWPLTYTPDMAAVVYQETPQEAHDAR